MDAAYLALAGWFLALAVTFGLIEWSVRRDRERAFGLQSHRRIWWRRRPPVDEDDDLF